MRWGIRDDWERGAVVAILGTNHTGVSPRIIPGLDAANYSMGNVTFRDDRTIDPIGIFALYCSRQQRSKQMVKITLRGSHGGELDCRTVEEQDGVDIFDQWGPVNESVKDIALNCVFSAGDVITIEEV